MQHQSSSSLRKEKNGRKGREKVKKNAQKKRKQKTYNFYLIFLSEKSKNETVAAS